MSRITITNTTASGNRKSWHKVVTRVDTSKTNGYAFEGSFVDDGEVDLADGTVVISKAPAGPRNHSYHLGECYVVRDGELVSTHEGTDFDWRENFPSFRDHVAEQVAANAPEPVNPLADFSDADLLAECQRRGLSL